MTITKVETNNSKQQLPKNVMSFILYFIKKYKISLFIAIAISSLSLIFPVIGGQYLIKALSTYSLILVFLIVNICKNDTSINK